MDLEKGQHGEQKPSKSEVGTRKYMMLLCHLGAWGRKALGMQRWAGLGSWADWKAVLQMLILPL